MNDPELQEKLEQLKARRCRERWSAFLTPLITLTSIVVSVSLLMFFIKTCSERSPQNLAIPRPPIQPAPPK
jgi:hypothetical protein